MVDDTKNIRRQCKCISCDKVGTGDELTPISGYFQYEVLTKLSEKEPELWVICDNCILGLAALTLSNMIKLNETIAHDRVRESLDKVGISLTKPV